MTMRSNLRFFAALGALAVALPAAHAQPEAQPSPSAAAAESPPKAPGGQRLTALTAKLTVKVVHPAEVRKGLIEAARPMGGFPTLVEDQRLVLHVPHARLDAMVDAVAGSGLVISKTLERADLTGEVAQLEALLRSKQAIFARLRRLVDDADATATLRIEKSMSELVVEMERLGGRLRVERARAAHAVVDVSFRFRQRQRVVYVRSPFPWLNTVDLERFDDRF